MDGMHKGVIRIVSSSSTELLADQSPTDGPSPEGGALWDMGIDWEQYSLAHFNDSTGNYVIGEHVTRLDWGADRVRLTPFPLCTNVPDDIPDCTMARPTARESFISSHPELAEIYSTVRDSGVPNYRGVQIPVKHALNIPAWRRVEHRLSDPSLVNMLAYGFPVGYASGEVPTPGTPNHSSALRNRAAVESFLEKEVRLGAMIGPLCAQPFKDWARSNPLMTWPKRESSELRVILDLSFPQGSSINAGIPGGGGGGSPGRATI